MVASAGGRAAARARRRPPARALHDDRAPLGPAPRRDARARATSCAKGWSGRRRIPGLTDYRAIFHAHASDSDHTGGTLDEILEDAHRARVEIVFLSDHPRPPRDFVKGWRGVREGVLFVPGAETESGYLLHPDALGACDRLDGPVPELLAASTQAAGLAFLSHLEDHEPLSFDGVTGTEIYNRHADAKDEAASMRRWCSG